VEYLPLSPDAKWCAALRSTGQSLWVVPHIYGMSVPMLVDTGSEITLLYHVSVDVPLFPSSVSLRGVSGHPLNVSGKCRVTLAWDDFYFPADVHISPDLDYCILGMDFFNSYPCLLHLARQELIIGDVVIPLLAREQIGQVRCNAISASQGVLPQQISQQLQQLETEQREEAVSSLRKFVSVFDSEHLGCTSVQEHRIELTDPRPVKQHPRRLSTTQRKQIEYEVAEMMRQGVI
jgi:hypothetical protein